jgi:hypothetical protein
MNASPLTSEIGLLASDRGGGRQIRDRQHWGDIFRPDRYAEAHT